MRLEDLAKTIRRLAARLAKVMTNDFFLFSYLKRATIVQTPSQTQEKKREGKDDVKSLLLVF